MLGVDNQIQSVYVCVSKKLDYLNIDSLDILKTN